MEKIDEKMEKIIIWKRVGRGEARSWSAAGTLQSAAISTLLLVPNVHRLSHTVYSNKWCQQFTVRSWFYSRPKERFCCNMVWVILLLCAWGCHWLSFFVCLGHPSKAQRALLHRSDSSKWLGGAVVLRDQREMLLHCCIVAHIYTWNQSLLYSVYTQFEPKFVDVNL